MKKLHITDDIAITEISMGALKAKGENAHRIMDMYLELGGNTFDTARSYFGGEYDKFLGDWINSRGIRNSVILNMKGCYPLDSSKMYESRLSPADIKSDLEKSLQVAGLDYADMYLLHRDDPKLPVDDIVTAASKLIDEGKTRAIGVSNWSCGRIVKANEFAEQNGLHKFCVSQLHFSLATTTPAVTGDITHVPMSDVEYGWYFETGFPVMAFSSQGKGFFGQIESDVELKSSAKEYYSYIPENMRRAARAIELGAEYGVSASAIALAYLRANPVRNSALVGFSSVEQFEQSMAALKVDLTPDDILYLEIGVR